MKTFDRVLESYVREVNMNSDYTVVKILTCSGEGNEPVFQYKESGRTVGRVPLARTSRVETLVGKQYT